MQGSYKFDDKKAIWTYANARSSLGEQMHFHFIANPTLMLILGVGGGENRKRTKSKLKAPGNLDSEKFPRVLNSAVSAGSHKAASEKLLGFLWKSKWPRRLIMMIADPEFFAKKILRIWSRPTFGFG